ncbi:hypothetical protein PG985_008030 [Apiospora marii]|uniref:uncharacterized protein n=1 Tax=Apiospora marii TaxID=335849 RepID=UPI003131E43F
MSQSKAEVAEKLHLFYSANPDFEAGRISRQKPESVKVHSNPDSWFQLTIVPEVRLTPPEGKDSNAEDGIGEQGGEAIEARIRLAFLLTETVPNQDDDDDYNNYEDYDDVDYNYSENPYDFPYDSDDEEDMIARYHSDGQFVDAMANLDPDDSARVYRTAVQLVLEGDHEPLADSDVKVEMATEHIRQKLYDMVMEVHGGSVIEFMGVALEDLVRELKNCLADLTPALYLKAVREALERLRALGLEYAERSKIEIKA